MEARCLFSIVTVSYNCAAQLARTIESVLSQSCMDLEYIVIDGGSTDGSVDVIRKYQNALSYWCSEPDGGIYQGMNKGIDHAQGEWIIFMNAGDVFAGQDVLRQMAFHIRQNPCDIIYGDILTIKDGVERLKQASDPCNKQRMYFCHQAVFVQTYILKQMHFDIRFRMSADFYFFKRCYKVGYRFVHVSLPIAIYDSNGISNTQRTKGLHDNIRVIKELDKGWDRIRFLGKLYFVIFWINLRRSLRKKRL